MRELLPDNLALADRLPQRISQPTRKGDWLTYIAVVSQVHPGHVVDMLASAGSPMMQCSSATSKAWTPCGTSWTHPYTQQLLARAPPASRWIICGSMEHHCSKASQGLPRLPILPTAPQGITGTHGNPIQAGYLASCIQTVQKQHSGSPYMAQHRSPARAHSQVDTYCRYCNRCNAIHLHSLQKSL